MIPFERATYRSQLFRLRKAANDVIKKFPIEVNSLEFIHHGENTTFKIKAKNKNYLLRIHRDGYHSPKALNGELVWLRKINKSKLLSVQDPVLSKNQRYLDTVSLSGHQNQRYCDLLTWQEGLLKKKKYNPKDFFFVGELTGRLHQIGKKQKTTSRNYWCAHQLLGDDCLFGPFFLLEKDLGKKASMFREVRRTALYHLKKYEKENPERVSMIHADLHFGNLVWNSDGVTPIDFDDCGRGCHFYDFGVITYSSRNRLMAINKKTYNQAIENLLNGYSFHCNLKEKELNIIEYYELARRISILNWLYSRKDHPRLANYYKKIKENELAYFEKVLRHGPSPLFL
jgi:Ser/Thr protein kinase RdoA (MazF antagonist)